MYNHEDTADAVLTAMTTLFRDRDGPSPAAVGALKHLVETMGMEAMVHEPVRQFLGLRVRPLVAWATLVHPAAVLLAGWAMFAFLLDWSLLSGRCWAAGARGAVVWDIF